MLQDNDASDEDLMCGISNRSILYMVFCNNETKEKFSWSSIAQLLGYYYRAATDHCKPGVAVLLSNEMIHIASFPFCTQEDSLSNDICFGGITFIELLD